MPFPGNSPQGLLKSISKSHFVNHCEVEQIISSTNVFLKGVSQYQEVEEGLWFILGDYEYKKNVSFRRVDDKKSQADYYSIRLSITSSDESQKRTFVNGMTYFYTTWLVFKPQSDLSIFHFKGAKELSYTVFFSAQWLKEVLSKMPEYKSSNIKYFFESEAKQIIWPDAMEPLQSVYQPFIDIFHRKQEVGTIDNQELKELILAFIGYFINKYNRDEVSKHFFNIPDTDRLKILKAERILMDNIQAPFIGIEVLAKEVGLSQTQLKNYFKMIFGETIFKYFRHKQMQYAHSVLLHKSTSIKEIARSLGYENASKFTAAFKQQYNILPSEIFSITN